MGTRIKKDGDGWNPTLVPFVKAMIGRNGVRHKSAVEVGHKAVDYIRGVDFCKWVFRNQDTLRTKAPKLFEDVTLETPQDAIKIGLALLREGFIYKAVSKKVVSTKKAAESSEAAAAPTVDKWPKRLEATPIQDFPFKDSFFIIRYESNSKWKYVLLALIIMTVLLICMFPAWPLRMKFVVWHLLVAFSTFMIIMVFVRLIAFVFAWFIGYDFWIWPNLFADELGVIESFQPTYELVRRGDDFMMKGVRVFCCFLFMVTLWQLNKVHPISSVPQFATQQLLDVVSWGESHLNRTEAVVSAKTRFDSKMEEFTEELDDDDDDFDMGDEAAGEGVFCFRECGYETADELFDSECMNDCGCIEKLLRSSCAPKCGDTERLALVEAKYEACDDSEL
eukprot:GHVO01006012.1.p1 GENE.GHVO01006012.1~~GHVO01006012.1.p1  ORF type:complete len:400 (+),score=67.87 GHVO01006012.1:25-1200(+)